MTSTRQKQSVTFVVFDTQQILMTYLPKQRIGEMCVCSKNCCLPREPSAIRHFRESTKTQVIFIQDENINLSTHHTYIVLRVSLKGVSDMEQSNKIFTQ